MARPRQIDRQAVLQVSLEIADEHGLDAVTMKSVADRLGVTPMALYRHVQNKDDLLDGVVETLLDAIPAPSSNRRWNEHLAQMGNAMRAIARRHPSVFPLLLRLPANTPRSRERRDRVQQMLRIAGVAERDVARAERLVSTIVIGFSASEVSGRFTGHSRKTLDEDYAALERFIVAGLATLVSNDGARRPPETT
jgi:AcrR family transcriptional regulator